ncbi:MAG: M15 family metallopeptidase [Cyclobacteriaceae bacterium]|nr:M15 family metallopeptidase [Cyclobacteriaceae bacterium]
MGQKTFLLSLLVLLTALGISFSSAGQSSQKQLDAIPYTTEHRQLVAELTKDFETAIGSEKIITHLEDWRNWETVENYTYGKDRGSLPMIADLDALHPYFKEKITKLIATCKRKGIELAIVESYRTVAKQNEYKAMGKKYTRATGGHSKHQYGLAIDVVPVIDSIAQWDNARLWKKIGSMGEQLGLRWGGRWRTLYDPGHFEWSGGLSGDSLAKGLAPYVPKSISNQYPCLEEDLQQLAEYWSAWESEQAMITRESSSNPESRPANKMNSNSTAESRSAIASGMK